MYNRDRLVPEHWIFGGIERGTRKCFMVEVADRSRQTLDWSLSSRHSSFLVVTSYAQIDQIQEGIYTHDTVIHKHNFVDPNDDEIHTQNVKNNLDAHEEETEEAVRDFAGSAGQLLRRVHVEAVVSRPELSLCHVHLHSCNLSR